jgi:hypothetical protein
MLRSPIVTRSALPLRHLQGGHAFCIAGDDTPFAIHIVLYLFLTFYVTSC